MPVFGGESGGMRRSHVRPVPIVPSSAFKGFRFPPEVIVLAVRWYLRFGLSYRDVQELLTERGIEVDHVTVFRWVQRFTPSSLTRPDRADTRSVIVGMSMRPM
jgi:transposase-like protein